MKKELNEIFEFELHLNDSDTILAYNDDDPDGVKKSIGSPTPPQRREEHIMQIWTIAQISVGPKYSHSTKSTT